MLKTWFPEGLEDPEIALLKVETTFVLIGILTFLSGKKVRMRKNRKSLIVNVLKEQWGCSQCKQLKVRVQLFTLGSGPHCSLRHSRVRRILGFTFNQPMVLKVIPIFCSTFNNEFQDLLSLQGTKFLALDSRVFHFRFIVNNLSSLKSKPNCFYQDHRTHHKC